MPPQKLCLAGGVELETTGIRMIANGSDGFDHVRVAERAGFSFVITDSREQLVLDQSRRYSKIQACAGLYRLIPAPKA
jgi:hypothetical protein